MKTQFVQPSMRIRNKLDAERMIGRRDINASFHCVESAGDIVSGSEVGVIDPRSQTIIPIELYVRAKDVM
jgi:hypothetical protein